MSIVSCSQKIRTTLSREITDLDNIEMINEQGLYQIFEGRSGDKVHFGVYLAYKTLKKGLDGAYAQIDGILEELKKREDVCKDVTVGGVSLVQFSDRLFIYHIKLSILDY